MKKYYLAIVSAIIVVAVLIGGLFYMNNKGDVADQTGTVTFANGNTVYLPEAEQISYDSETNRLFYEGILNVYLLDEVTTGEADELAALVEGEVVGQLRGGVNLLQLHVAEETYDGLTAFADTLMTDERVNYASVSVPSTLADLAGDIDCTDVDSSKWWYEAINWGVADQNLEVSDQTAPNVTVSVIEMGRLGEGAKDIEDDNLRESVTMVSNKRGTPFRTENRDGEKVINNHARHVTQLIGADPSKMAGLNGGVAYGFTDIRFTGIGEDIGKQKRFKNIQTVFVPEPYLFSTILEELHAGTKVINLSFGDTIMTEKKWANQADEDKKHEDYDAYEKNHPHRISKVSVQLIVAFDRLFSASDHEFLIMQAAGNGKITEDEAWDEKIATDARNSGFFTNINAETYGLARGKVRSLDASLEDIQNHIMVVGGAKVCEDEGRYYLPKWSSYGEAIDIVAPAENITIAGEKAGMGTSFATPMVTGAAALVWYHEPDLTAREVKERLIGRSLHQVAHNPNVVVENVPESYPLLNLNSFTPSAYVGLFGVYKQAIKEQWDVYQLDEAGIGPLLYDEPALPVDYGFYFADINGDGSQELILGRHLSEGQAYIEEVYTLVDDVPVRIFRGELRLGMTVYEDGTMHVGQVSPGTGDTVSLILELCENEAVNSSHGETEATCLIEGYLGNIGNKEAVSIQDESERVDEAYLQKLRDRSPKLEVTFIPFID